MALKEHPNPGSPAPMSANKLWEGAEAAVDRKDFPRAEQLFRRALATQSSHVPSLVGLSTVLSRRSAHREAHSAALAAHSLRPTAAPLIYAVAQRLRYFHEFERLVDCLTMPSLALEAPADILAKASVMLSSVGAHDAAAQLADKALRRNPTNAAALHVRGNYYLFQGDVENAEQCYEASLRSDPLLFQNSWMLAGARSQTSESNHVDRLRRQLLQAKPRGTGEVYVAYALHKELHDLERYDEAWQALERACAAKRRQSDYALSQHVDLVGSLEQVCTREFVSAASPVHQPSVPIFIVGMHRSGTTLLERMLAGHSQVGDAGETSAFHAQLELAIDRAAPTGMDSTFVKHVMAADFDAIARGYADTARWLSRGNPFFTEKLPPNFLNVGFIAKAMPQARFLHLVRDPMDTCFSNLRTLFSGTALYSYDQAELGGFFLQYQRMMAHWHEVLPGRVLDISYDDLVRDPATMAQRIARHCGLEFEPGMVDIGRASGTVATPSATVARPGERRDRGRAWQPYEAHLGPLRDALAPAYAARGSAPE